LRCGNDVLYIDPCLSDFVAKTAEDPLLWRRRFVPPLRGAEITDATAVLYTHEHADHFDQETLQDIRGASPLATVLVPACIARETEALLGTGGVIATALGSCDQHRFGSFLVTAVPAAHSTDYGVEQACGGQRWLGYVVEVEGRRIYHAGDTVTYEGQAEAVGAGGPPDLALLPINGRDAYRERNDIIGNLWPREAAELARELGARVLVPLHYDLFASNGVNPGALVDYVFEEQLPLEVRVLAAGQVSDVPGSI
jgi:L-ascorbate metabolism protein UlaG (beta-lactamase superfamily)